MCGIAGKFLFDQHAPVAAADVRRMCDALVHRGPDDEGIFTAPGIGVGMRRLSIIDLAGGHQPMTTTDGRYTIVFNGEIYNYREVRRQLESDGRQFRTASDTECILQGFAAYGPDCLQLLNGMFGFAIWDARERVLFVARDRIGVKPLYWRQSAEGLTFASEMKAILSDPAVPRRLDHDAFSYFLRYGYVSAPATLFDGIRQLPPAHYLVAGSSGVKLTRYWSLEPSQGEPAGVAELTEAAYELTKRAVERQMVSDVPLGAFLSGGLDSASMVHMMAELSGSVSTYSIGFEGSDAFHSELDDARRIAERYRTNHHEIIVRPDAASLVPTLVRHLDQPLADSSFLVTYLVSTLARQTVKVIISGVGGDELFGGYRRYLGPHLDRYYDAVPKPMRNAVATASTWLPVDRGSALRNYARLARSYVTSHGLAPFERYDAAVQLLAPEDLAAIAPAAAPESSLVEQRRRWFAEAPAGDPLQQMLRLDFHTSLVDSLLLLTDKMTMATSLEARVPFLDHELVEAVNAMPSDVKLRRSTLRYIQKESMRGRLPDDVMTKKKRGFGCPVGAWFRTDLRPLLRDTLSADALRADGVLDADVVGQLITEHETLREDRTDVLLALLTFQLWRTDWRVECA